MPTSTIIGISGGSGAGKTVLALVNPFYNLLFVSNQSRTLE
ncbi:hypothetical protein [Acaryochloris sp. IP29b_bin.148]|nr:hypothetical protein [Acaryochloris sp. IP29b_bin.148]